MLYQILQRLERPVCRSLRNVLFSPVFAATFIVEIRISIGKDLRNNTKLWPRAMHPSAQTAMYKLATAEHT
ncbi:hypothetical protein Pr1d_49570 [Bythopirellula goksoeyrii]|uniref:Uncharacterized protein n=1 Tax=Bythopirellula goksoeyrii TaxID=1400387 RepID=A0A5B9QU64_9BACT|nr:hypothetical protein Pr1d_49570 [Bythopirellula goksoeyrii]